MKLDAGTAELFRLSSSEPLYIAARSFFFLRHGQTDANRARMFQPPEQPLNERGLQQALHAARALGDQPITRIFSSTMARAWETAALIGSELSIRVTPEPLLREKWFGDWIGRSSAVLDWVSTPPNGEALADFVQRTRKGLAKSLRDAEGTLIVAHGGTLYVLAFALGLPVSPEMLANATPLAFVRAPHSWTAKPIAQIGAPTTDAPS